MQSRAAQYNPSQSVHTKKLQVLIKAARGVSYDAESSARENKTYVPLLVGDMSFDVFNSYAKHLMEWGSEGHAESAADIKVHLKSNAYSHTAKLWI